MTLTDLFDIQYIQLVQDTFSSVAKVASVIVDPHGTHITLPSNQNTLCNIFTTSKTEGRGNACQQEALQVNRETGRSAIVECPKSGLVLGAVPLMLHREYIGSWLFGQFWAPSLLEQDLEELAQEMDLPKEQAKQMLYSLPVMAREEFLHVQDFLETLCHLVLRLGEEGRSAHAQRSKLEELNARLKTSEMMQRKFIDSTDVAVYVCERKTGRLRMVNNSFCKQVGRSKKELVGQKCWVVNGVAEEEAIAHSAQKQNLAGRGEMWIYYNKKFKRWLRCVRQAISWIDGSEAYIVTQMDVSDEYALREEMQRLAFHDKYTKLPNGEKLEYDIRTGAYGEDVERQFLVCFHLAGMRSFNDVYGRQTGITLMRTITVWIQQQAFGRFTLYRLEDYGFCIMLHDSDRQEALRVAQAVCTRFEGAWVLQIGGETISHFCTTIHSLIFLSEEVRNLDLLNLIDRTQMQARDYGTLFVYDEEADRKTKEKIRFEVKLKTCVKQGMKGFGVQYQPIVEGATGRWKGLEVLCRWDCPGVGAVSPVEFIPIAERLGLIGAVGEWVLETSLAQCKKWGLDSQEGFFLSVNVSPRQMTDVNFALRVEQILQKYNFPGERLTLEVTESVEMRFDRFTRCVVGRLKERGVALSLDDFGTGYSSFNNLKNLPVDFLKTERSFISNIEKDSYLQYYYYVMSEMAHANAMTMIAEGVETKEQLDAVRSNGADYIQGFYFSRPLFAQQVEENLHCFAAQEGPLHKTEQGVLTGKSQEVLP